MNAAKQLRQKILDLAIRGQLVPQNPKDEPAEKLLQRIWEGRAPSRPEGRGRTLTATCSDVPAALTQRTQRAQRGAKSLCVFADSASAPAGKTFPPIPDEKKPFALPKGWAWCRLGEIFKFIDYRGKTPRKINSGIPLITARNVRMGYIDYTIRDFISEDEFSERKSRGVARRGDVLFTTEAPLGYVALADLEEFSTGQRLICFQQHGSNELFSNKLITFFLQSSSWQKVLFEHKTGTTVAGIKAEYLKQLPIPLPPLAEQKRIVAKVEALLKDVEKYERAVEGLTGAADDLSKKILDLAIRGQLTKRDPKDEPADKLLQRIWEEKSNAEEQRSRGRACRSATAAPHSTRSPRSPRLTQPPPIPDDEKPFPLPKGWAWCRLDEISNKLVDGDHNPPTSDSESDEYLMISALNIGDKGLVDLGKTRKLSKKKFLICNERTKVEFGDILLTTVGTLGRSCIFDGSRKVVCQRSVSVVHSLVDNRYLKYCFDSPYFQIMMAEGAKGTAQKGFYLNQLKSSLIPLPPLAEQKRIVAKVEELLSDVERLKGGAA